MKKNIILLFLMVACILTCVVGFAHSDDDDEEQDPCAHYTNAEQRTTCELTYRHNRIQAPPSSQPEASNTIVSPAAPTPVNAPVVAPPKPSPVVVEDELEDVPSVVPRAKPNNIKEVAEATSEDDDIPPLDIQTEPRLPAGVRPQVGLTFYNGRSNEPQTPCITVTEEMIKERKRNKNAPKIAGGSSPACAQTPPRVERKKATVDILIVTDLPTEHQAQSIIAAFKSIPPFKCLPITFQVAKLTKSQLNCRPEIRNGSMVKCSDEGRQKIRDLKNHYDARAEIAVIQLDTNVAVTDDQRFPEAVQVAANYTYRDIRQSFVGHQHAAEAGVHEFLHTVGFYDDYEYVTQNNPKSGTIMNSVFSGNVPKDWWDSISNFLGYDAPTECAWPSSAPVN